MLKKCCKCKMMVPPRIRECPFCGEKYTDFEYFRMNMLPTVVIGVVALTIALNIADIMIINKKIRSVVKSQQVDEQVIEELKKKCEKKFFLKQNFIRISELNSLADIENTGTKTEGDAKVTVKIYSQNGSTSGEYKGELQGDVPNGVGEFSYSDANGECLYEGEFVNGKIEGTGQMRLSNGWRMMGTFFEGQLNGYGKKISPDGVQTERGMFVNSQLNGRGIKYAGDGNIIFDGEFSYGLPSKFEYINLCENVDITTAKPGDLVGKNIMIEGKVSDLVIDPQTNEEYFIMSAGEEGKIKFKVFDTGTSIVRRLQVQHKIYGYCESVGDFVDSTDTVLRGVCINSFYCDT